jgi:hypothetical protein
MRVNGARLPRPTKPVGAPALISPRREHPTAPAPTVGPAEGIAMIGDWTVVRLDQTGKRATVRCSRCGVFRLFAADAVAWFRCEACPKRPA